MSHSIYIDESNGNGLYSVTTQGITNSAYRSQYTNNTDNSSPSNKNLNSTSTTRSSNEDLSQSLSEYTDAEESMSAPTEFLAEFLSAVMLKDYKKAFKYCKLILQYEPHNATAKEFYPLIQEKLKSNSTNESGDENCNKSSSVDESENCDDVEEEEEEADDEEEEENVNDDEDEDDACDDEYEDSDIINTSSSNDQSSLNESQGATSEESYENIMDQNEINNSGSSGDGCAGTTSSSGGYNISRSDNTTHSYSSLLLEEDDDVPQNVNLRENINRTDLDIANGNFIPTSCSDSESPTEPLTQRLAAILNFGKKYEGHHQDIRSDEFADGGGDFLCEGMRSYA